jgi:hypothetical protein
MTQSINRHWLGRVLIISAVFVSVPRYAGAFLVADAGSVEGTFSEILAFANAIGGAFMAPLEVIGAVFMLASLGDIKRKIVYVRNKERMEKWNERWVGVAAFTIALHLLAPIILSPYVVSRVMGVTVEAALQDSFLLVYLWSFAVVVAPILVIGGVEFTGYGLVSGKAHVATQQEKTKKTPKKLPAQGQNEGQNEARNGQENGRNHAQNAAELSPSERLALSDIRKVKSNKIELERIAAMAPVQIQQEYGVKARASRDWPKKASDYLAALPV